MNNLLLKVFFVFFCFFGVFGFVVDVFGGVGDVVVVDGDTLRDGDGRRVRIWGIDAPELKQTCLEGGRVRFCGEEAKGFLLGVVERNVVRCVVMYRDRYGRDVARCDFFLKEGGSGDVKDLGREMVWSGWALDYVRYSRGVYSVEEKDARENGRGIWSSEFEVPWEWRRRGRRVK